MAFNPEQLAALKAKLDPSHVKERKQGGSQVSYVEGWHAIAEANRIFGFDGWTRETLSAECVYSGEYQKPVWENGRKTDRTATMFRCTYNARVRVTAGGVFRDGTGSGHGFGENPGDAHESAIKEAETDAMKRALMTFGNPFGLALYDKTRENVGTDEPGHGHATNGSKPPAVAEFWRRASYTIPVQKDEHGGSDWVTWAGRMRKAAEQAPDAEKRAKLRQNNAANLAGLKEIAPGEFDRISALIDGKPLTNPMQGG